MERLCNRQFGEMTNFCKQSLASDSAGILELIELKLELKPKPKPKTIENHVRDQLPALLGKQ